MLTKKLEEMLHQHLQMLARLTVQKSAPYVNKTVYPLIKNSSSFSSPLLNNHRCLLLLNRKINNLLGLQSKPNPKEMVFELVFVAEWFWFGFG